MLYREGKIDTPRSENSLKRQISQAKEVVILNEVKELALQDHASNMYMAQKYA